MQLSAVLFSGLLATAASAYRIDLWRDYDYQGTQRTFTSPGIHTLGFGAKSWIWSDTIDDGCCVVFCRGAVNVGKYCGPAAKAQSSAGTNKVVIGCGATTLNC